MTTLGSGAVLPRCFQPRNVDSLVRIGRKYDGGYVIDERNINQTNCLIGLGILDDWSFEAHFYKLNKVPVFCVDGSVGKRFFFIRLLESALLVLNPRRFAHWLKVLINYYLFFRNSDKQHLQYLIGLNGQPGYVSLTTLLEKIGQNRDDARIYFKIDIEGWEYRIMDELLQHSDKIIGLAIEFHDVDLHLERLEKFIEEFPLNLCHVHCNNYAPKSESGTPTVIECSFTRDPIGEKLVVELPNKLDMPNKPDEADYAINFG